jgi:2-polyprenyl-3-methyl-5-hydroxy-6-metoxy-1,4-benzoquinol methylase
MLNFDNLVKTRTEVLKKFIKNSYKNGIDIGCGTGADSIALTMNGINMTGYDTSLKMIQKAKLNAGKRKLKIKFSKTPVQNLANLHNLKYDFVVSLGNAIANIDQGTLNRIFNRVNKLLKPEGSFLIQILNYESIRKSNKRIVNITRGKDSIFVRFYDFDKNRLSFNVLRINDKTLQEYNLITTELYEYKKGDLKKLLAKNGFNKIKFYSDLNKSAFNSKTSKDLIILAEK